MTNVNAIRILKNSEARLANSAEGIYDDDFVLLFWENVEAKYIDECLVYLNHVDQRIIYAPENGSTVFYDASFSDDLHHLHAYYSDSEERIYRVMMKSSVSSASYTESGTRWRLLNGETYESGTSNLILSIYNVDPDHIVSLEQESIPETIDDGIYLIGGTQLTGTWFNVRRESEFNSSTGLYDLRWYISRYNSKEYIFRYLDNNSVNSVEFFKHHMTSDAIDDFEENYYFDSNVIGEYYYSTDGINYTKKNNEAATGTIPSTAKNILTEVAGRNVVYDQRPNRENGEIDITLQIRFVDTSTATSESDLQEYTETRVIKRNATSIPSPGTPADGTIVIIESTPNPDGTFDTIQSTRVFNERTATSGSTNAFTGETVTIATNASAALSAPQDQADGTILIHESEQLENGLFRNITRTRTARTDVADVTDSSELSDQGAGGYTQSITKKYNQTNPETISESDTGAGKIVEVENNINEDGTYNTIKSIRTERSLTAEGGSTNAFRSESVTITNNANAALGVPSDQSDGTIKIHESEQLPNGLYRNIERTITSRTDLVSATEITELGVSSSAGFVESITREYNQTSKAVIDPEDRQAGSTLRIENTINEDGTFNTFKSVKIERQAQAEGGKTSASNSTIVIVTNNASEELGDPTPGFTLTITGSASSATGVYKLNPTLSRYERMDNNNNYDEQWSIFRDFQQTGSNPDTFLHSWLLYDADTNTQYYFTSNYSTLALFESAEKNPTDGTIANGSFSEKSEGLHHITDNSIIQHESQQLENGLFRNIQTISTNNNQTVTSESKLQAYTDTIEFNSASSTKVTPGNPAAGTQVTVENNVNEDGTFNTVKRTRVFNSQSATGGASTDAYTETVVIEDNASTELGAPGDQTDGTTVIHESQQLENGKFRNITRTRTARTDVATVTDSTEISDEGSGGYLETITKKYNQTLQATISEDDTTAGKIVTVENDINEDGTFNTVKRVRTERSSTASAKSESVNTSTTVEIVNNATAALGTAQSTPASGTTVTRESIPLENGLFRNITTTVSEQERADDQEILGQLSSESVDITYNTTIDGQASLTAEKGKIKTRLNEELDNGLYKVTERTVTATAFPGSGSIDDETISGAGNGAAGYTEEIIKKFNQSSAIEITASDKAAGKVVVVENNVNEDGTFNTVKRIRTNRELSATAQSKTTNRTTDTIVTQNSDSALGNVASISSGQIINQESVQQEDGLFSTTSVTTNISESNAVTRTKNSDGIQSAVAYISNISKARMEELLQGGILKYDEDTLEFYEAQDEGVNNNNLISKDFVELDPSITNNNAFKLDEAKIGISIQVSADYIRESDLYDLIVSIEKIDSKLSFCRYFDGIDLVRNLIQLENCQTEHKDNLISSLKSDDQGNVFYDYTPDSYEVATGDLLNGSSTSANASDYTSITEDLAGREVSVQSFYDERQNNYNYIISINQVLEDNSLGTKSNKQVSLNTFFGVTKELYSNGLINGKESYKETSELSEGSSFSPYFIYNKNNVWYFAQDSNAIYTNDVIAYSTQYNTKDIGAAPDVGWVPAVVGVSDSAKPSRMYDFATESAVAISSFYIDKSRDHFHNDKLYTLTYNATATAQDNGCYRSGTLSGTNDFVEFYIREQGFTLDDGTIQTIYFWAAKYRFSWDKTETASGTAIDVYSGQNSLTERGSDYYSSISNIRPVWEADWSDTIFSDFFFETEDETKISVASNTDTREKNHTLSINTSPNISSQIIEGLNVTRSTLESVSEELNRTLDGSGVNYNFTHERSGEGLYNYKLVIVFKKGVANSIKIGNKYYYIGEKYPLPPTTDRDADPKKFYIIPLRDEYAEVTADISYSHIDDSYDWTIIETERSKEANLASLTQATSTDGMFNKKRQLFYFRNMDTYPDDISSVNSDTPNLISQSSLTGDLLNSTNTGGVVTTGDFAYQRYYETKYTVQLEENNTYTFIKEKIIYTVPTPKLNVYGTGGASSPKAEYYNGDDYFYCGTKVVYNVQNGILRTFSGGTDGGGWFRYTPDVHPTDNVAYETRGIDPATNDLQRGVGNDYGDSWNNVWSAIASKKAATDGDGNPTPGTYSGDDTVDGTDSTDEEVKAPNLINYLMQINRSRKETTHILKKYFVVPPPRTEWDGSNSTAYPQDTDGEGDLDLNDPLIRTIPGSSVEKEETLTRIGENLWVVEVRYTEYEEWASDVRDAIKDTDITMNCVYFSETNGIPHFPSTLNGSFYTGETPTVQFANSVFGEEY